MSMSTQQRLRFGVKTSPQYTTYADVLRVWQEADAQHIFEHAWLFDHFYPINVPDTSGPCLEGWTLLAALLARTERIRGGIMVTGNTHRHPAVLANMAATVDIVSQGRLDFGIGAAWNQEEHDAYGIPLFTPVERIRRLDEACQVIRGLWTQETTDFDGRYYHLEQARCEPKPIQKPHPPIVIGALGEKLALRVVARHADIWNFEGTLAEFQHKNAVLNEHCAAIGRDPATIERSVQFFVNPANLGDDRTTARDFIKAGATHIVLYLYPPFPEGIMRRLTEEIAEPLQEEFTNRK
jgi:F420-dependent oxidoreductase-like protein